MNWTAWMSDRLSFRRKGILNLDVLFSASNFSKAEMVNRLAEELRISLNAVRSGAGDPDLAQLRQSVTGATQGFIRLANLGQPADKEFIDFIVNVMQICQAKHFPDNNVHSGVVTFYSAAIAKEMGFSHEDVQRIKTAGVLHDIGKGSIHVALLAKTRITEEDKTVLDRHLPIGVFLLREIKWLKNVVEIVSPHHPNPLYDRGFYEGQFFKLAQIFRLVDVYDGLTSRRAYKMEEHVREFDGLVIRVFSRSEALEELAGAKFPKDIIEALCRVTEKGQEYIEGVSGLFQKHEIKFIWPGIEHLIRKNLLPREGGALEEDSLNEWMMPRAPILWIISPRRSGFKDMSEFLFYVKNEVRMSAREKGLEEKLNGLLGAIAREWSEFSGVIFEVLFRAISVDAKYGSRTFDQVISLLDRDKDDLKKLLNHMDVLCLDPKKEEAAFYLWLSSRLYGENTRHIPFYGEEAFMESLKELTKYS